MSGSAHTHARKAPSDSKRWTNCTSSLAYERMFYLASLDIMSADELAELHELLNRFGVSMDDARAAGYSKSNDSIYSSEGTRAHDWAEKVLLGQIELKDVPELDEHTKKDMRDPVSTYVHECRRIAEEEDGMEPFVESQVPLFYNKAETGTMDYAVVSERRVRVRDYKHGAGEYVKVDDNPQLATYAMSFMQMLEDDGFYHFEPDTVVEIGIVQPRHREWDPDHLWVLSYHDLKIFCAGIQKASDIIDEGIETVFAPSYDACRWCRLKAFCGVRLHHMTLGLPSDDGRTAADFLEGMPTYDERGSEVKFEKEHPEPLDRINIYTQSYGTIPLPQMVKIYSNRKGITAFLSDIEKYLTRRALEGNPADGTKLVIGREGNTAYTDERAAAKLLEDAGFSPDEYQVVKVISPAKATDLLGDLVNEKKKKNPSFNERLATGFKALLTRSPGKKVLALESDKRPAAGSNLDGFEDLEELSETAEMED